VPESQPVVPVFLTFQLMENSSPDLKWAPFLTVCMSSAQSSATDSVGVWDGSDDAPVDGEGPGDSVGSRVADGARVREGARSAFIVGVGVGAFVGLDIGVDGAAQDAKKSTSAMKAIAFLISLPFLLSVFTKYCGIIKSKP
jgi:hypothetical protein